MVTLNERERLYVIPEAGGYSCLGFEVCEERITRLADALGLPRPETTPGTLLAYEALSSLQTEARRRYDATGERCLAELTPQLVGLEGKRVEVTNADGFKRRFNVGRSTGWIPVHLEVYNRRSRGGMAAFIWPTDKIRVIGSVR